MRHGRACGEPPTVITCPNTASRYLVRQLLGKGGFARVYRVAHLPSKSENENIELVTSSSSEVDVTSVSKSDLDAEVSSSGRGESGSLNSLPHHQGTPSTGSYEHFALKVITKCRLGDSAAGREVLRNEVNIHRQLRHPHIVKLLKYWEDEYRIYLLMDLVEGPSLEQYLRSRGRLSEQEVSIYACQVFEALAYLHAKRIIHRDIKLANFLLSTDLSRVQLCDFGLATHLDSLRDTASSSICGTPNYVAPELLTPAVTGRQGHRRMLGSSNRPSDKQIFTTSADCWSMGVALFTMLTGTGPFDSEDLHRTFRRIRTARFTFPIGLKLSANAKSLIRCLLAEDFTKRPTVEEALRYPFFKAKDAAKHRRHTSTPDKSADQRSQLPNGNKRDLVSNRENWDDRANFFHANALAARTNRSRISQHRRSESTRTPSGNGKAENHAIADPSGPRRRERYGSITNERDLSSDDRTLGKASQERTASLSTRNGIDPRRAGEKGANQNSRRRSNLAARERRSSLNSRALKNLDAYGSNVTSSGRRASFLSSEKRNNILNLSVTLSAALLRGRKYLDDDKEGRAAVGRKQRFASVTTPVDGTSGAPPLVRRWLDYTSKYGFASLMEDGRIGCCFNDGSIMFFVSQPSELPDVAYIPAKGSTPNSDKDEKGEKQRPADISKKATLCTLFADMILDGGPGSMHDLPSACNVSFLNPDNEDSTQIPHYTGGEFSDVVHVREWARFRNFRAIAFRLSNNSIHVKFDVGGNFCDEYVFNPTDSTLFYREAESGAAWVCPVRNLGEFSSHSEYIHWQLQICSHAITRFLE